MTDLVERNGTKGMADKKRQQEWRESIPEAKRIVFDVAPRAWRSAEEGRIEDVPEVWCDMVEAMRADVHAAAEKAAKEDPEKSLSIRSRRGYAWNWKVSRVADMIEYLLRTIEEDIGFDDGGSLASMVVLRRALLHVQIELQDGGSEHGRDDGEEFRYRTLNAMKALLPYFDDVNLRRFRALSYVEYAAKVTRVPSDDEVEQRCHELEGVKDDDERERHRKYMTVDWPVMNAMMAIQELGGIDKQFALLDPLVVLEELAEAEGKAKGGRSADGEGKTGAARALARLAVRCGALEYQQRDDEDFDTAVERARGSLLTTRSRIRKELRSAPGTQIDSADL